MAVSRTKLDTTNAEHIIYKRTPLEIAILGGIRLDGLDRLRTTLKIQVEHLAIRHNLDLYNDNQLEKLTRKAAERLEVGTSVVTAALLELIDLLEEYRLSEIERQAVKEDQRKMLSPEEIKKAKLYLSSPNLMERTKEDIGKAGVIGEETNRLLMYLIFTSRKRETPLHIISLGASGIGKTHLQEKVSELIPEEDKLEMTSLSENAFYYFGQRELQNKLILIEDMDGAEGVLYPLRELQSKRKINKTIVHKNTKGETQSINLKVEGPVCVAGCTTKERLYEDNANRSFLIHISESALQDEQIMNYQRAMSAGRIDKAAVHQMAEQFKDMQRILRPVEVRNPFAEQLRIPSEVFKPRRSNAHYLAFIEVVTFYHQYQREKQYDKITGEEYIATTLEDIKEANALMKEVLLRKSDELSGACRNYFEKLKQWLKEETKTAFTNRQARQALREKPSNQKKFMVQLQAYGHIKRGQGDQKKGYYYEIVSPEEYQQLRAAIDNILDQIVKGFNSSEAVLS